MFPNNKTTIALICFPKQPSHLSHRRGGESRVQILWLHQQTSRVEQKSLFWGSSKVKMGGYFLVYLVILWYVCLFFKVYVDLELLFGGDGVKDCLFVFFFCFFWGGVVGWLFMKQLLLVCGCRDFVLTSHVPSLSQRFFFFFLKRELLTRV